MTNRRHLFSLVICLILGSWILYEFTPPVLRNTEWTKRVLRNWGEYGFFKLGGKLADNVAGQGLPEHPRAYEGHRPACLYPAMLVQWVSGSRDGLAFHIVLSLVVGIAVWHLLGRSATGTLVALMAVFAPGYLHRIVVLDPLDLPVVLGLPFLAGTVFLLERKQASLAGACLIFVLLAVYAALNWTTLLALGITFVYLAVTLRERPKTLLFFALVAGACGATVLVLSLLSKAPATAGNSGHSGLAMWFNSYLFGPRGYDGRGMTWARALSRIVVINSISLFRLWIVFFFTFVRWWKRSGSQERRLLLPLWPVLAAVSELLVLRNYFGAHPWMAGAVLLFGLVFSFRLLLPENPKAENPQAKPVRTGLQVALPVAGTFAYSLLILTALAFNETEMRGVVQMVFQHTTRHDVITFSPQESPWIAANAERLSQLTDRVLLPMDAESPSSRGGQYRLSEQAPAGNGDRLASSKDSPQALEGCFKPAVEWYRVKVSKRPPGDRFAIDRVLYLTRSASG